MTPATRRSWIVALVALVALAPVACGGDDGGRAEEPSTDLEVTVTDPLTGKPVPPDRLPGTTEPGNTLPDTTGPDPPSTDPTVTIPPSARASVDSAVADLAGRLGTEASAITVVDYRAVTWGDASLGCPQPDMSYIQRLTPGSLLVLRAANGTTFEYHGGPDGTLSYCAAPRPPAEGQGAD